MPPHRYRSDGRETSGQSFSLLSHLYLWGFYVWSGQVDRDVKKFDGKEGLCSILPQRVLLSRHNPRYIPYRLLCATKILHTSRGLVTKCRDVWWILDMKRANRLPTYQQFFR